jgi:hypothetical protein
LWELGVSREGERKKGPDGALPVAENWPDTSEASAGDSSFELRSNFTAELWLYCNSTEKKGIWRGGLLTHVVVPLFPDFCLTFPYWHSTY